MSQIINDTALYLYNVSIYISECSYCIMTICICIRETICRTTEL